MVTRIPLLTLHTRLPLPPKAYAGSRPRPSGRGRFFYCARALYEDRALAAQIWDGMEGECVSLRAAAAFVYHYTRRAGEEAHTPAEYASALDIAGAALSRLAPVYAPDAGGRRVAVAVNLARQRFFGGAAALRGDDGSILAPIEMVRGDVVPALRAIERTGIAYVPPRFLTDAALRNDSGTS